MLQPVLFQLGHGHSQVIHTYTACRQVMGGIDPRLLYVHTVRSMQIVQHQMICLQILSNASKMTVCVICEGEGGDGRNVCTSSVHTHTAV